MYVFLTASVISLFTLFPVQKCLVRQLSTVRLTVNISLIPLNPFKFPRISSRGSFDNLGLPYNVSRILNADATFNEKEYAAYSPLYLSTTFAISYGLSFASITATLTHAILYFRKQIWTQARRSIREQPDIHARLMSHYSQVPEWWYIVIFCECTYL